MSKLLIPFIIVILLAGVGYLYIDSLETSAPAISIEPLITSTPEPTGTPGIVGGDKDAHGCIGSAGYSWCELKKKCLRVWEEPCASPSPSPNIVGGDKDIHGCIGSAGYTWCEEKQKCLRAWEEPCNGPSCALQTCHGLNLSCGYNSPMYCTAVYEIGDKCLKYAECGYLNGICQPIENAQFTKCKSCVLKCIEDNKNDSIKMFECESTCDKYDGKVFY